MVLENKNWIRGHQILIGALIVITIISIFYFDSYQNKKSAEEREILQLNYDDAIRNLQISQKKLNDTVCTSIHIIKKVREDLLKIIGSNPIQNGANVEITENRIENEGKYIKSKRIVGVVKNTGNIEAKYVEVNATFYDSRGEVIFDDWSYALVTTLKPGESSPFRLSGINKPFIDYRIEAEWLEC